MKKNILFLFCAIALNMNASPSDSTKFSIYIIDYSLSWTSSNHYYFDDEEIRVEEVDNIDKSKKNILVHRQLLGKEKDLIRKYLSIFQAIDFQEQYVDRFSGERNQKRINFEIDGQKKSILITNYYQQDIAGFISFLNSFIPPKNRMKEFVDPNKPIKK